jgi:hypothetical protein
MSCYLSVKKKCLVKIIVRLIFICKRKHILMSKNQVILVFIKTRFEGSVCHCGKYSFKKCFFYLKIH